MNRTREQWNSLFESRTEELPPEEFLVKYKNLLRGPRVLDLACGDGRNSFYLAELGFQVCALDFSEVALNKIDTKGYKNIKTLAGDLERVDSIKNIENFDTILINHFIPLEEVFLSLMDKLNNNGRVFLTAFNGDGENSSFYPNLSSSEVHHLLPKGEIIVDELYSNSWGDFRGIIIKRRQI